METMGFSDQEEQKTNSAESPETGETESAENSAALQAEAEAPDTEIESSQEELESPGSEESVESDSTETEPELESEVDSPEDAEVDTAEPAAEDAVEDQPLETDQPPAVDQEPEEAPVIEELAEPEVAEIAPIVEAAPEEPEKDSVELDLSFLDQDQADQGETEEDGRSWYVVHCYSGYENKVRHNLEQRIETMGMKNMIFDIVVPTEEEIEVKEGKRRTVERRVFPGYILVNMIMTEESWYVVRNTPGVTGFVGMGNTPTPLRTEEVSQIIKRMEADAPRIKVTFKSGERVRIVDGPFNDFRGTVSEIDMERAKVRVMVNFFGRETPVELDFLQVEKT
jgi:transcriptional antiterminator NusG